MSTIASDFARLARGLGSFAASDDLPLHVGDGLFNLVLLTVEGFELSKKRRQVRHVYGDMRIATDESKAASTLAVYNETAIKNLAKSL